MRLIDLVRPGQPRLPWRRILLASLGAAIAVALLGLLGDWIGVIALFVGFAPSCLLVFTLPEAPVSQPPAVIGGHFVASAVGVLAGQLLPVAPWSIALAVGVAIVGMAVARILHPPAVGNTVIAMVTGPGWIFLLIPALSASMLIVVVGILWHRLTRTQYPVTVSLR